VIQEFAPAPHLVRREQSPGKGQNATSVEQALPAF
jgi:hypothetical protein